VETGHQRDAGARDLLEDMQLLQEQLTFLYYTRLLQEPARASAVPASLLHDQLAVRYAHGFIYSQKPIG
jgi:hypothetical protein